MSYVVVPLSGAERQPHFPLPALLNGLLVMHIDCLPSAVSRSGDKRDWVSY